MAFKKKIKYMSKTVRVNNALAADSNSSLNFIPDKDYAFVTGVRAYYGTPGSIQGGTHILLSITNSNGDIIEPSHQDGWIASTAVPMDQRWRELEQPIDGSAIKCTVNNPTLSTALYDIIFEFRLEDELVKFANVN